MFKNIHGFNNFYDRILITIQMTKNNMSSNLSLKEKIILLLSIIGLFITSYLIYAHFKIDENSICNISDTLNCDIVNKSSYAEIFGIPVSIGGFAYYLFMTFGVFYHKKNPAIGKLMVLATFIGLIFSLYLTYVEAFILFTYCIFCLIHQANILILTILTPITYLKKKS